jgi:hypothetical protein
MDINTLLTELVILANDLDGRAPDVTADVDAAIFIMSSEGALPRNKSLASVVRENYVAAGDMDDITREELTVLAAEEITALTNEVLEQKDTAAIVAVLTSMAQSLRSIMHPNGVMSPEAAKRGAKFLLAAENKLSQSEELLTLGYRVGLVRSKIENPNGQRSSYKVQSTS